MNPLDQRELPLLSDPTQIDSDNDYDGLTDYEDSIPFINF